MRGRTMSSQPEKVAARLNWRLMAAAIAAAGLLVFFAANTHLVYVAFSSQPDCHSLK